MKTNSLRAMEALGSLFSRERMKNFTMASEQTGRFDANFIQSYSQAGEDIALSSFIDLDVQGRYIDIGAYHPNRFSVTRLLYTKGWRGVNVDANKYLIDKFHEWRPGDINICAAIGQLPEYELSICSKRAMSSVVHENIEAAKKLGFITVERRKVKGQKLRAVYDTYLPNEKCNILSLDIEGNELDALESMDFTTLPKERFPDWILVETSPPVHKAIESKPVQALINYGYIVYAVLPMSTLLRAPNLV